MYDTTIYYINSQIYLSKRHEFKSYLHRSWVLVALPISSDFGIGAGVKHELFGL